MQISQYIIIKKKNKWSYGSRMTKESPALASNEIAVKVSLEIPDAIFDKPTLQANITIPAEAVSKPVINAEVIDNVQEVIKQNTGFNVKLEVVDKDEEK
jgi:hypothetical protein